MKLQFLVTVELTKTRGRFVPREELLEEIQGLIEGADPGQIVVGEHDSEYDTEYTVEERTK